LFLLSLSADIEHANQVHVVCGQLAPFDVLTSFSKFFDLIVVVLDNSDNEVLHDPNGDEHAEEKDKPCKHSVECTFVFVELVYKVVIT
jgi:hypothetical protein